MRPDAWVRKSLRERASFSKATRGCPASRSEFSRALADSRNGKKPLDFSGFCWLPGDPGALEALRASLVGSVVPVIAIPVVTAVAVKAHSVLEPMPPAFPAPEPVHMGQDGEPALLAVIERLVERVGRVRDLFHGRR